MSPRSPFFPSFWITLVWWLLSCLFAPSNPSYLVLHWTTRQLCTTVYLLTVALWWLPVHILSPNLWTNTCFTNMTVLLGTTLRKSTSCSWLGFTVWPWLSWNLLCRPGWPWTQKSSCLCLPSAGIKGVRHHAWLFLCFCFLFFVFLRQGFSV